MHLGPFVFYPHKSSGSKRFSSEKCLLHHSQYQAIFGFALCRGTPSPLHICIWVFGYFFTFFRHGIEEVERHLLWKLNKKNSKERLVKCTTEVARLYTSLYTKSAVYDSSIALARLKFNFLSLGGSPWNLAHLFTMLSATNRCLRFFNFCPGTKLWSIEIEKWGKIIAKLKLWKIITKKKSDANFVESALLLFFCCENRFCRWWSV